MPALGLSLGLQYSRMGASGLLNGLVSHWKLDEASGTRNDSHGTNHLTDTNTVTQAVGKVGNAAQFTAANSEQLQVVSNSSLQLFTGGSGWTIASWVYLDSVAANQSIISKYGGAPGREAQLHFDTATARFQLIAATDGTALVSVSANTLGGIVISTWYLVITSFDLATGLIGIQGNNGAIDTAAFTGGILTSTAFRIGTATSAFFGGRVDSVSLWKRPLTVSERARLWNSGNGLDYNAITWGNG